MIYAFPQYFNSKSRFLTYNVVAKALLAEGHKITDNIAEADAVLYSCCDVMDLKGLRKLRKETSKPIIAGGAYAFNYWSLRLYCDLVWIGEIYEMAELKTLEDINDSPHCYNGTEKDLYAAQLIKWDRVPITQIKKTSAYYWGGVGCSKKCSFCFTSWTHKHETNRKGRIEKARQICQSKKISLMVVSNEYDYDSKTKTKDMLLTNYLKIPVTGNFIRCGIEFADEQTRKAKAKPITDKEIFMAIQKAKAENLSLRLFHITGYEPLSSWERYIDRFGNYLDIVKNNRLIHLMFNNLQYQNYTPLYKERKNINPDNYISHHDTKRWYDLLRQKSSHILLGAPSPFQHVACRMGLELSTTKEQSEFWFSMLSRKDKTTKLQAYDALFETGVLDTEMRKLNFNTGKITVIKS